MNSPPILEPILAVGLNRMFTGGTIGVLSHSHGYFCFPSASERGHGLRACFGSVSGSLGSKPLDPNRKFLSNMSLGGVIWSYWWL